MAVNIGPKIGIDGENEYRRQLNNIIQTQKTLKAEMDQTATAFDKNATAQEKNRAKAESLTKQIENQKNRVAELEKMVQASTEKYTAADTKTLKWKQALAEATAELNRMEQELKEIPSALDRFSESAISFGEKATSVGKTLTKYVTVPIVGAFTAATKAAINFEDGMAKVYTIADSSVVPVKDMSAALLDLSNKTGKGATELAEAAYQALSASVSTENAAEFVATAADLAKAGFLETSSAVDVLTTVINAYKYESKDAAKIADILVQTQNDGKTTVDQLAQSMGPLIATAAQLNVSFEQLSAGYVILTKQGINTANATTYLSGMISELSKEGSTVAEILKDKTGKSFAQLMADGESLADVLGILSDSVDGDSEALSNLWSNTRTAGRAAMAIANGGLSEFNAEARKMATATGNVSDALKTLETPGTKAKKALNQVTNAGIELGDRLAPYVGKAADKVMDLVSAFDNLSDGAKDAVVGVGLVVAAIGPVTSTVGKAATGIGKLAGKLSELTERARAAANAGSGIVKSFGEGGVAGVVVGATVAAAAALMAMQASAQESNDTTREFRDSADETAQSVGTLKAAVADARLEYEGYINSGKQTAQTNEEMIAELVELSNAYDGTLASQTKMEMLVDKLNGAIPELNLSFDKETGAINRTAEAMTTVNRANEAQARYAAAYEARTQAAYDRAKAEEQVNNALSGVVEAEEQVEYWTKRYNDLLAQSNGTGGAAAARQAKIQLDAWTESLKTARATAESANETLNTAWGTWASADAELRKAETDLNAVGAEMENVTTATENLTDATEGSAAAQEEQSKQISESQTALKGLRWEMMSAILTGGDLRATYNTVKAKLEELDAAGVTYDYNLTQQRLDTLNLLATNQELANTYPQMVTVLEACGVGLSDMSQFLIDNGVTVEDWGKRVDSATNNVINSFKALDTSLGMTVEEMAANLASNISAYTDWNANIEKLMQAAIASGDATKIAFVQHMQEMGIGAAEQVAVMAQDVEGTLDTFGPLWGQAAAAGMTTVRDAISSDNALPAATATAMQSAQNAALSAVDWSAGVGQPVAQGVAQGITAGAGEVADAATDMMEDAEDAARAQAGIHSPSTVWQNEVGKPMAEGVSKGIESAGNQVSNSAKKVVQDALTAAKSVTGWDTAGRSMMASLAAGINSGKSQVVSAAQSAGQSALYTMQGIVSQLKNIFNFSWTLPHIKLPHFSWAWQSVGNFLEVPTNFSVSWYKSAYANPVMFNSPTVLQTAGGFKGFGDGRGGEIVIGRDMMLTMIREAVTDATPNYGDINIVVNPSAGMDEKRLAQLVGYEIANQVNRRRLSWA